MRAVFIEVDAKDFIKGVSKEIEDIKHIAHMGVREGCIAAGLEFRQSVRMRAPRLNPKNRWGTWKNSRNSRNRYPLVAGELAKSVYFTYSRLHSDIPNGYIQYLVGLPYSNKKWVPGWYGHIVNEGYTDKGLANFWVKLRRNGSTRGPYVVGAQDNYQKFPLKKGSLPWNDNVNPSWRPWIMQPKSAGFVERGYKDAKGRAEQLLNSKTDAKIRELLGRL